MWFGVIVALVTLTANSFSQETDECKCVIYYLCDKNRTIIDDGEGLIVEKFGAVGCECNCPKQQVCCRLRGGEVTVPVQEIPCGVRNPDGVAFKGSSGDDNANFGEFPWAVDILTDNGANRCGGSLIHPSVVLTAAHCVTRKRTYIVRAGDWDNSNTNELLKHQDLGVASIKIHEDYNPAVFYNDIALLFLNGSFSSQPHIQPVCLPPSNADLGTDRCFVAGRGKDQSGQYPPILKRVDLPLVGKDTCQTQLRQTSLGQYFNLHRSCLCAGDEKGKDACVGDGGAALVCPISGEDERYQQVGIVSWGAGVGCHEEGKPGVYSNVVFLREWIDKQMKSKNLAIDPYVYRKV